MDSKFISWIITIILTIFVNSVAGQEPKFIIEPYGPYRNYTAIKQRDSKDDTKGVAYDYLNFMSSVRINELNLINYGRKCQGYCLIFRNHTYRHKNEANGAENTTDYCSGRLRNCDKYKEPERTRSSNELERFRNLMFDKGTEEVKYQAWLKYRKSSCSTCRCYCDNSNNLNKTSSFCLDDISSNIAEGYIISGVRLILEDQMVKIQYQQAKLGNNQFIDQTTRSEWKGNTECVNVSKRMNFDHRSVQLDDILLPLKSIITGLSFSEDTKSERIYLSVYGKDIKQLKNTTISSTKYSKPLTNRINLMTPDMDLSTAAPIENITELSKPDKYYVTFQPMRITNDENEVDEQLMPFVDIRKLAVPDELLKPLNGLGIYWRSCEGYGGYIAFKLILAGSPDTIQGHMKQIENLRLE